MLYSSRDMEEPLAGQTIPLTTTTSDALDRLSAVEVADLLLLALALHRASAIAVGSVSGRHELRVDHAGTSFAIAGLAPALGDAVVARLAILAHLEVGAPHPQVGKLRVQLDPAAGSRPTRPVDLLVSVRPTAGGLAAELYRVATLDDAADIATVDDPTAPAGGDAPDDAARIGKYQILEELGRGGMGTVFRGEHVVLQKPVAIKVLNAGFTADPTLTAQFVLEARAACRARHPGIVDVTDFGRFPDGRAFLVMELVDAPTLAQVLERGPLELTRALEIARQVADALRAAAEHGVVHRDLKPANIFVGEGDRVKLGDFGVARIIDATSSTDRAVVGTTGYMAPEQARGELADTRADLYSLGCVLHEMLTGRAPDAPGGDAATPALPASVQRLLARATARDPAARFQTADELIAALVRVAREVAPVGWRRWQS